MMRVNEAKQTLVNFSEMEFISGLPYFWHNCNCFCFPVGVSDVVAAVVRFFFVPSNVLYAGCDFFCI